ncbi:PLAC8 family protein isoform 1 [Hibiscus syriacus]|uniref:PLAC8 family protein isoform 1 n=1 Tax=Hibiscus syriacus TaxID=106335 RepID=A0A6A3AHY1_HIBSY|nr:PLAC8 family protein isoform 1 [Hibiscus syriacus]
MEPIVTKWRPVSIILLLLLMLSMPCFSAGGFGVSDNEVYEIDYRGPETHSATPPPDNSHHHRHWIHRKPDTLLAHKSSKGLKSGIGNRGRNAKKIHG